MSKEITNEISPGEMKIEDRVENLYQGAFKSIESLDNLFKKGGFLEQSVSDLGGDITWFNDVRNALDNAMQQIEGSHKGAVAHLQMKDESVEVNADVKEETMGAPDYNPAKASKQGPGYASLPQPIKLAGDSIWDRDGENPPSVTMTDYEVEERDGMIEVVVMHDGPWTVYTDSGFEKFISDMIGTEVSFSEQGMQEDGRAHLEGSLEMESADLTRIKKLAGI